MIVSSHRSPVEPALGLCLLISGAGVMTRAIVRAAFDRRSAALKLSDAILAAGFVLLSVELVTPALPDEVRLPLVVGSIAAIFTSFAIRRLARRKATPTSRLPHLPGR